MVGLFFHISSEIEALHRSYDIPRTKQKVQSQELLLLRSGPVASVAVPLKAESSLPRA